MSSSVCFGKFMHPSPCHSENGHSCQICLVKQRHSEIWPGINGKEWWSSISHLTCRGGWWSWGERAQGVPLCPGSIALVGFAEHHGMPAWFTAFWDGEDDWMWAISVFGYFRNSCLKPSFSVWSWGISQIGGAPSRGLHDCWLCRDNFQHLNFVQDLGGWRSWWCSGKTEEADPWWGALTFFEHWVAESGLYDIYI